MQFVGSPEAVATIAMVSPSLHNPSRKERNDMEAQSTQQPEPRQPAGLRLVYALLWLGLFAAISYAIWRDIIKAPAPDPEKIALIAENNKALQDWCQNQTLDTPSDCQAKITRALDAVIARSLDDQRKRLWLILLTLLIGTPLLVMAATRALRANPEESQPVWIILTYGVILGLVLLVITIAVWNRPDPIVAYVPVPILEWSFAGGMVAVINRLANPRPLSRNHLYRWMIARPIIGIFMGGVIYFIALAGAILTKAPLTENGQLQQNLWLNAIAFVAAFNDRFADGVIRRMTSMLAPEPEKDNNKE